MLRVSVYLAVAVALAESTAEATLKLTANYHMPTCGGVPTIVRINGAADCVANKCSNSATGFKTSTVCSASETYLSDVNNLFGSAPFILRESYNDASCTTFHTAEALRVDGECVQHDATGLFVRGLLETDGSATMQYFLDASCSPERLHHSEHASKQTAQEHSCDANALKWYLQTGVGRALEAEIVQDGVNATAGSTAESSTAPATVVEAASTVPTSTPTPTPTTTPTATPTAAPVPIANNSLPTGGNSAATTASASKEGSVANKDAVASSNDSKVASSSADSNPGSIADSSTGSSSAAVNHTPTPTKRNATVKHSTKASSTSLSAGSGSSANLTTSAPEVEVPVVANASSTTGSTLTDRSSSGSDAAPTSTANSSFSTLTLVWIAAGVIAVAVVGIAIILRRVRSQTVAQTPVPGAGFLDPYRGQTSPFDPRRHTQQQQQGGDNIL